MLPDKEIEVWRWNLPVVEGDLNPVSPTSQCILLTTVHAAFQGFPGGSVAENPPASAGDAGSVPGLGRSTEKEMTTHSNILAWRIPRTEEPVPNPWGCKESDMTEHTHTLVFTGIRRSKSLP